jgi:Fic family protein
MADGAGVGYIQTVMQRPPQMPSILSTRQAYQWINRIAQKHKQVISLPLSQEQVQALNSRIEVDFITSLLALDEVMVSRKDVLQTSRSAENIDSPNNSALAHSLAAYRLLKAVIQSQKQDANLDVELLLRLHSTTGTGGFRQQRLAGSTVRPENLPIILDSACRWFASSAIRELNPVEQAALAFLRFVEISPFDHQNERTALLAASLFTLRQELPPIIIKPARKADYDRALNEGLRMNTQPMVDLVAISIEQSLDDWLNGAEQLK